MDGYYTTSEYSPAQPKPAKPMSQMDQQMQLQMPMQQPMQMPAQQQMQMPMHQMNPMNQMMQQMQPQQYKYNADLFNIDVKDLFKRATKYFVEGLAVAFVAYYFTKNKLDIKEILMLAITASLAFALLDFASPTIALGTRFGAGFGVGNAMFGLTPGMIAPAMMAV